MARLLPLLLAAAALALTLGTHALPFLNVFGWSLDRHTDTDTGIVAPMVEPRVGPGCVNGDVVYPGIPSEVEFRCANTDPPEPYIITNEYDCSSYYVCTGSVAYLICCPSGLLYDPPMGTCHDPAQVDCGSRPILDYPDTSTTAATA